MRIWQRALAAVTRPGGCAADPRLLDDWRRWHETGGAPPGWTRLMEEMGEEKRS